jgi:hypothetical protein
LRPRSMWRRVWTENKHWQISRPAPKGTSARRTNGVLRSSHFPSHPGSDRRSRTAITACARNSTRVSCGRLRYSISVDCDPMRTRLRLLRCQCHRLAFWPPFVFCDCPIYTNTCYYRPLLRNWLRRVDLQYPGRSQPSSEPCVVLPLHRPTRIFIVLLGQHHHNIFICRLYNDTLGVLHSTSSERNHSHTYAW